MLDAPVSAACLCLGPWSYEAFVAFRKVQNQSSVTSSTLSLAGWGKVAQKKCSRPARATRMKKKGAWGRGSGREGLGGDRVRRRSNELRGMDRGKGIHGGGMEWLLKRGPRWDTRTELSQAVLRNDRSLYTPSIGQGASLGFLDVARAHMHA